MEQSLELSCYLKEGSTSFSFVILVHLEMGGVPYYGQGALGV